MIAVFGANGFLGRHLVQRLVDRNIHSRAIARRLDPHFVEATREVVDWFEADLREPVSIAPTLQDVETVVQLISNSTPGLKNDAIVSDIEVNVVPQIAFLQLCVQLGVKRVIFLSSGGTVYGPGATVPTVEEHPTNPISSHGLTKLTVENYLRMYGHVNGLEYVVLRAANPFGPGQIFRRGQGLIPALLDRWRHSEPVRIYGTGESRRDYVYIDDMIDAIENAVALPGSPREIINIGSGETQSTLQVIQKISSALGESLPVEHVASRDTDVDTVCLSIERASRLLNWRPRVSFDEGVDRTVAAYLEGSR